MPSKIILKKSSVAAKAPVAGDLDFGELAINYTDSKLYFKKADGSIDSFTSAAASAPVTSVGGNTGAITDAQLLASIKNVDGTGSGLDADFLDGNTAADFYLASNPNGYTSNTGTVTSVGATAPIVSSGGTTPSLSIAAANSTTNGYMTSAYATKLDGISAGAQVNVATNLAQGTRTTTAVPITSSTGTTATLDIATTLLAGVMSSADKTKLDGIASGATANTGTVTSVGGTGTVSGLSLSGTVTTSGNLTLGGTLAVTASNFASQTANTVLAAPTGVAGVPTFRTLVADDIPSLDASKITSGIINVARLPSKTVYILESATNNTWYTIAENTTATESDVSGKFVIYDQTGLASHVTFIADTDASYGYLSVLANSGFGSISKIRIANAGTKSLVQILINGSIGQPKFTFENQTGTNTWTPIDWVSDATAYTAGQIKAEVDVLNNSGALIHAGKIMSGGLKTQYEVLNTNNYTGYAPTLTGTGASGSWGINVTGTSANVTGTVALANGGTGATTSANARTNLGATTLGGNLFTLTNVAAIAFPRINADNTVSSLNAATFRTAIGAGTSSTTGTVTSVAAGNYLTGGTITTSGTLAVDATSANTASKVVARDASGNFAAGIITSTGRQENYGTTTDAGTIAGITGGTSGGTIAVPTQTLAGTPLYRISSLGHTGSAWTGGAKLEFVSTENFTSTNRGTNAVLSAIAAGGAIATSVIWNGSTLVANGTTLTGNTGTVTSVSGTGTVSGLSLSGTVTSSGNLTLGGTLAVLPSNFASQTANTVLAAPNGVAGVPTFRAILAADIPTLNQNTTGTAANVTGTVAVANGGTGSTTAAAALTALGAYAASNPSGYTSNTGTVTSIATTGSISGLTLTGGTITTTGTITLGGTLAVTASNFASQIANTFLSAPNGVAGVPTFRTIVAADIPTLNQNTTGTSANVTGTVAVANGGTGSTTAAGALTNLGAYAASNPSSYITTAGARSAVSFTAGSGAYNSTTGVFTIPTNTNQLTNGAGYITSSSVSNGTLTMNVSGTGLSGSQTFTANQSTAATFTVTSNATSANTVSTIVARDASGNFTAGTVTATSFVASSDERLKTNWRDLQSDFVEKLALVKHGIYDRIDIEDTQAGVSAQSLREVINEAVTEDEEGMLAVNYGSAALVSSIELAKKIVEQDEKIARLEALVLKLIAN